MFAYSWGMLRRHDPKRIFATVEDDVRLIRDGTIRPEVRHTFPLDRVADAHRMLTGRLTMGKVVLHP